MQIIKSYLGNNHLFKLPSVLVFSSWDYIEPNAITTYKISKDSNTLFIQSTGKIEAYDLSRLLRIVDLSKMFH